MQHVTPQLLKSFKVSQIDFNSERSFCHYFSVVYKYEAIYYKMQSNIPLEVFL